MNYDYKYLKYKQKYSNLIMKGGGVVGRFIRHYLKTKTYDVFVKLSNEKYIIKRKY